MPTPVLANNPTLRKQWIKKGALYAEKKSFWTPYIGTDENVIQRVSGLSKGDNGHNITFQGYGALTDRALKGDEQAEGKGESKRRFSSQMSMVKRRDVVNNGNVFEAIATNDVMLTQHSNSVNMLSQKIIRHRDQYFFDLMQGSCLDAHSEEQVTPTHKITINNNDFNYNKLMELGDILKTGRNVEDNTWNNRLPLAPTMSEGGDPMWIFVCDTQVLTKLKKDSNFQTMFQHADVRGRGNRIFTGFTGRIGHIYFVEAPPFYGRNESSTWTLGDSEVECAGMRRYDTVNSCWSGDPNFVEANTNASECFFLGKNALQFAVGKTPEYHYQAKDFENTSESAVEWWSNAQRTIWNKFPNDKDYVRNFSEVHYGIINVRINFA